MKKMFFIVFICAFLFLGANSSFPSVDNQGSSSPDYLKSYCADKNKPESKNKIFYYIIKGLIKVYESQDVIKTAELSYGDSCDNDQTRLDISSIILEARTTLFSFLLPNIFYAKK
ncbi:hypothetical protein AYI69_g3261 [Smittium culicis]|uniref:Uncharacterized protein n=1 Tax=Smittium culicis TaxID=133412 RepID=A0A1R1YK76_9FUNG|nr:hypothetical protein AYI69_g3261 [Smittium culicis]